MTGCNREKWIIGDCGYGCSDFAAKRNEHTTVLSIKQSQNGNQGKFGIAISGDFVYTKKEVFPDLIITRPGAERVMVCVPAVF